MAGLRCSEVLASLSDFVDRLLPQGTEEQIREHLLGCDWCERFGAEFALVVGGLRRSLGEPDPVEEGVTRRLAERLSSELR